MKEAEAVPLGLDPLLKAFAFIVALLARDMAPVYRVDDWVGVEPSRV